MVQSEVEVVKLTSLFQKVLYRWLEGRRFNSFNIESDTPSYEVYINKTTFSVTAFRGNHYPSVNISFMVNSPSPSYEYWVNGVADFDIKSKVAFFGRGKLLLEFRRDGLGTDSSMWYPYVSEIVAQLNESQRFALEMTLRDTLTQLDKEVEYRKKISNGN
jgi:hypothetical protein